MPNCRFSSRSGVLAREDALVAAGGRLEDAALGVAMTRGRAVGDGVERAAAADGSGADVARDTAGEGMG